MVKDAVINGKDISGIKVVVSSVSGNLSENEKTLIKIEPTPELVRAKEIEEGFTRSDVVQLSKHLVLEEKDKLVVPVNKTLQIVTGGAITLNEDSSLVVEGELSAIPEVGETTCVDIGFLARVDLFGRMQFNSLKNFSSEYMNYSISLRKNSKIVIGNRDYAVCADTNPGDCKFFFDNAAICQTECGLDTAISFMYVGGEYGSACDCIIHTSTKVVKNDTEDDHVKVVINRNEHEDLYDHGSYTAFGYRAENTYAFSRIVTDENGKWVIEEDTYLTIVDDRELPESLNVENFYFYGDCYCLTIYKNGGRVWQVR